jgi:hypothetical protein
VATAAHISIEAHVTLDELSARMPTMETSNGFANRFLYVLVDRSKLLPSGGSLERGDYEELGRRVRSALETSRRYGRIRRTPEAEELWCALYGAIAADETGGLVGAVTARAEAHLLRLSLVYALMDCSNAIDVDHLEAAWSFLCYCDESARFIFGERSGDRIVDGLLERLRQLPPGEGLDGTQQRDLFGRHVSGAQLDAARAHLERIGLVENLTASTGGRPRVVTFLRCDASDLGDETRIRSLRSLRSQWQGR